MGRSKQMKDRYEARKVIIKVEIPRRSIYEDFPYPGLWQLFRGKSPESQTSPSSSILALYLSHEPVLTSSDFPNSSTQPPSVRIPTTYTTTAQKERLNSNLRTTTTCSAQTFRVAQEPGSKLLRLHSFTALQTNKKWYGTEVDPWLHGSPTLASKARLDTAAPQQHLYASSRGQPRLVLAVICNFNRRSEFASRDKSQPSTRTPPSLSLSLLHARFSWCFGGQPVSRGMEGLV